jgi:hypothetical protein
MVPGLLLIIQMKSRTFTRNIRLYEALSNSVGARRYLLAGRDCLARPDKRDRLAEKDIVRLIKACHSGTATKSYLSARQVY